MADPMRLRYERCWWARLVPGWRSAWLVYRRGVYIGTAIQLAGRRWLAAQPDAYGTYHVDANGAPQAFRRRDGAVLRLAMAADGIEP